MRSPRANYRAASVLAAVAALLAVVALVAGMWLLLAAMCLLIAGTLLSCRNMRRRGIDWRGPTTYRELRARLAALHGTDRERT
jgi:hypothetical protein